MNSTCEETSEGSGGANEKRGAFHSVKHRGSAQEEEVAQVDEEDAKRKDAAKAYARLCFNLKKPKK